MSGFAPDELIENLTPYFCRRAAVAGGCGAVMVSAVRTGTALTCTSSTAFVEMNRMYVNVAPTATCDVLLTFSTHARCNVVGREMIFQFYEGATAKGVCVLTQTKSANYRNAISMQYLVRGVASGSHTYKVRWRLHAAGTMTSDDCGRIMTAMAITT